MRLSREIGRAGDFDDSQSVSDARALSEIWEARVLCCKSVLVRNQMRRRIAAGTRVIALTPRYALLPLPAIGLSSTNLFDQTTSASIDELMVEILVVRVVGYIHTIRIEGK